MRRTALIVLGVVASTALAQAQDGAGEVLAAAAEACEKIESVRYTVVQRGVGDRRAAIAEVKGTVIQQRADVPDAGLGGGRYLAHGTIDRPDGARLPFAWSYDGAALRVLDHDLGIISVIDAPDAGDAGRMLGMETALLAFQSFMDPRSLERIAAKATRIEGKGTADIAGIECDLVEVEQTFDHPTQGRMTSVSTWAFGKDDHLPRMFEAGPMRREVTRLEANPVLAPADFALTVPRGFEERRTLTRAADTRGLLAIGAEAPAWTLEAGDGTKVSMLSLRGRVVVLDFWATWCQPCRKALPGIQALRERFSEDRVAVFGVSVGEQHGADPAGFLKERGCTYPALLQGEEIAPAYKATALPTVYVIDREGKVVHAEKGFRENAETELVQAIDRALGR